MNSPPSSPALISHDLSPVLGAAGYGLQEPGHRPSRASASEVFGVWRALDDGRSLRGSVDPTRGEQHGRTGIGIGIEIAHGPAIEPVAILLLSSGHGMVTLARWEP